MCDRRIEQTGARLLYFDERPSACMRAIEAADDIRLPIRTVSHPESLREVCRAFQPTSALTVLRPYGIVSPWIMSEISTSEPGLPVLIACETDICADRSFTETVASLDLDVRGSVRLGTGVRDLQLALLCAASRFGP